MQFTHHRDHDTTHGGWDRYLVNICDESKQRWSRGPNAEYALEACFSLEVTKISYEIDLIDIVGKVLIDSDMNSYIWRSRIPRKINK